MTDDQPTARPLTVDDIDGLVRLIGAAEALSPIPIVTTRGDLVRLFDEPTHDLATDTLAIVDDAGALMGYVMTSLNPDPTRRRSLQISGRVHPLHRGRGLGTRLVRWAVQRGRQRLADHDDRLPKEMRAYLYDTEHEALAIFEACGFEADRRFVEMERDLSNPLPTVELPAPLEVVTSSPDLDEAVRRAHNEAFADHWGSEPLSAERWARWITGNEHHLAQASFVVVDGNAVAGYAMNAAYPAEWEELGHREGWINSLGTRPAWRGRGIASALIVASCQAFRELGYDRAALGVDTANSTGALHLYERHQFVTTRVELALGLPVRASDD